MNLEKIKELMRKIREYKNSGLLTKKLFEEVEKDKNIDVNEQYKSIVDYSIKYNK